VTADKRLSTKLLLACAAGVLISALFTGTVVISIGVGSELTSVNTVMSPLVCPGDEIVPAWQYRGYPKLADGPALRTRWICVNKATGAAHVAGYRTIFTAGIVYGLILAVVALAVLWRKGVFLRVTS
jgi:hypothetical protein